MSVSTPTTVNRWADDTQRYIRDCFWPDDTPVALLGYTNFNIVSADWTILIKLNSYVINIDMDGCRWDAAHLDEERREEMTDYLREQVQKSMFKIWAETL